MVIELTDDEALVLDALLADYGTKDPGRLLRIDHAAERNALWALAAALEKQLVPRFNGPTGSSSLPHAPVLRNRADPGSRDALAA